MILGEDAPRPDGSVNETENRKKLVTGFRSIVNRAAEQIEEPKPFRLGYGSLSIRGFDITYQSSSFKGIEKVGVSNRAETPGFYVSTTFEPYEDDEGKSGIRRQLILEDLEGTIADLGSRELSVEEMRKLNLFLAQPPLYAALIDDLAGPTHEERVKIDEEITWRNEESERFWKR